jgi:hypothetical protein
VTSLPSAGVESDTVFRSETSATAVGLTAKLELSESVVPPDELGTV